MTGVIIISQYSIVFIIYNVIRLQVLLSCNKYLCSYAFVAVAVIC